MEGLQELYIISLLRFLQQSQFDLQLADSDDDDSCSLEELKAFIHPQHFDRTKNLLFEETMADLDKNKDGFLDVEEYISEIAPLIHIVVCIVNCSIGCQQVMYTNLKRKAKQSQIGLLLKERNSRVIAIRTKMESKTRRIIELD